MKKVLTILVCSLITVPAFTQNKRDSLRYYNTEIGKMHKKYVQQYLENDTVKMLQKRIFELRRKSDSYSSFMVFANMSSLDLNKLNADNASSGFAAMKGNAWTFGLGFSGKSGRSVFDLTFFAFGKPKKVSNGEATIKLSSFSAIYLDYGYDLIKNSRLNIYPYVGLMVSGNRLTYDTSIVYNPSPTNIANIIINNRKLDLYDNSLRYKLGIGVEYVIHQNSHGGGTILFAKAGSRRAFKEKGFKYSNRNYDPHLKYGEMDISFGFKFFGRN